MNQNNIKTFLKNHFRYNTMNSWNQSTSYAHNLKVYKVIPQKYQDRVFELLEQGDIYDDINFLITSFDRESDYAYQAGFNGRMGGYLVLYKGGQKDSDYKSYCVACGQKNYTESTKKDKKCGVCGKNKRVNYDESPKQVFTYSGKSIDMDADDIDEMDGYELKERYALIKRFDLLADDIVKLTIKWAKSYEVKEKTVKVAKTIKVLQAIK